MTIPDLVSRVKTLNQAESAKQVEKFVLELLGQPKRSEFLMIRLYKKRVLAKLRQLRD